MRLVSISFNNGIKMLLPWDQGTHITVNVEDDFVVMNGLSALTAAGEVTEAIARRSTTTAPEWTSTMETVQVNSNGFIN